MKRSSDGAPAGAPDSKMAKEEGVSAFSELDIKCVNELRVLGAELPSLANSGHPGAPIGMAPMAYTTFTRHMAFSSENPKWPNRDRFVLSNGHASALQYSLLYLFGYLDVEQLKKFRQIDSITPGHPETLTPGVEVTTGPLGQGFCNAVGLAMSYHHLATVFNKPDLTILDNYIYCTVGDGCMMEGITAEAASMAGHLGLGRLIVLYDDNNISIAGGTNLAFTENVQDRFKAYGWHTSTVVEGDTDLDGITDAITEAKLVTDKPSFISIKTVIGYKSAKQGTAGVHGSPLSKEHIDALKKSLGVANKGFPVSDDVLKHYRTFGEQGREKCKKWVDVFEVYKKQYPKEAAEFQRRFEGKLPENWKSVLPKFTPADKAMATRELSGIVLNAIAPIMPELLGGSADLGPSTKTDLKCTHEFQKGAFDGRLIQFGVREHAMCAIANGMNAYGGVIPYTATFLAFLTYCFPSVRLSALSKHQTICVFTHDSIFLGEDGPTHQPIEVLAMARALPNILVIRPADGNETVGGYIAALEKNDGPTLFSLSRQGLPQLKGSTAEGVLKGAYVIHDVENPKVILLATGSEVSTCIEAAEKLGNARVVSMPCTQLFDDQPVEYRETVLLPGVPILSVEASSPLGWGKYAHGHVSVKTFGKSGKIPHLKEHFGFTGEKVAANAAALIDSFKGTTPGVLTRTLVFAAADSH